MEEKAKLLTDNGFIEGMSSFSKEGFEIRKAELEEMTLDEVKAYVEKGGAK